MTLIHAYSVIPKQNDNDEGIFSFLLKKQSNCFSITSDQKVYNLTKMIDISSSVFDQTITSDPSLELPVAFEINLMQYSVILSNYLIQGVISYRAMKDWKFLGKNPKDNNWTLLDHQENQTYCQLGNLYNEDCKTNPRIYFNFSSSTPYQMLRFEMHQDRMENISDIRFRLGNFEIYGTLLQKSHLTCKSYSISHISFHTIIFLGSTK